MTGTALIFDYNFPSSLVTAYYQKLYPPAGKHLVWFENSAHDLFYGEPQRVVSELLAVLKKQP